MTGKFFSFKTYKRLRRYVTALFIIIALSVPGAVSAFSQESGKSKETAGAQTAEPGDKGEKEMENPVGIGYLQISIPNLSIPLDEVTKLQLERFAAVTQQVGVLNRIDFFKPYNNTVKKNIAGLLTQAASAEPDDCHNRYLESLAGNIMNDRFYSTVPGWHQLSGNLAEIVFMSNPKHLKLMYIISNFLEIDGNAGNYVNQDPSIILAEVKKQETAASGSQERNKIIDTVVYINDIESTLHYRQYARLFARMGNNLPTEVEKVESSITGRSSKAAVPKTRKIAYTPRPPQIKIAHLIYASMSPEMEMVYPGPELFHIDNEQGKFKIVFFKNLVYPYLECLIEPIARAVIDDRQLEENPLTGDLLLSHKVMHRISHHLGPVFSVRLKQEKKLEMELKDEEDKQEYYRRKKLLDQEPGAKEMELVFLADTIQNNFEVVEEIKADALAIHNSSLLFEEGIIPENKKMAVYTMYVVNLLVKLRQVSQPARAASLIQLNYLLESGAVNFNITTKKLSIHEVNFQVSVERLAGLIIAQYSSAYQLIGTYGKRTPIVDILLEKMRLLAPDAFFQLPESL